SITIEGSNDNPEEIEISGTHIDENQDGAVVGTLSTTDKDLSDTHTYTVDDHRFEVVDGDLKLKEGIALDHETDESVDVEVTTSDVDGATYLESFTIEVNDINEAPVSLDSSTTITEDSLYRFTLSDFPFSDRDNADALEVVVIETIPVIGSLELNGTKVSEGDAISRADISAGLLTFLSEANESGNNYTQFNFRVNDGELSSDIQTFTVSVTPIDDAPFAGNVDLGSTLEDTSYVITAADLLASASDIDGDSLSIQSVTLADPATGHLADNNDGTWSYTPTAHYFGDDVTFNFTVSDGSSGDEASASATLDVISVNDAAVVTAGGTLTYTENDGDQVIEGHITLTDIDSVTIESATITISSNFVPDEDRLAFNDHNGISGSWDLSTGTLTLSGTATVAEYQAALRTVTYSN
ncbi:cadherin-like domain-containing protein, partial [Endozoicomonas sp. SESOKO3]|uniref:cadherin-like domain-containing protein n=1 Tax=Endozoicomonas sp. SESOKO3 TaxID=2828744 RepID=UPI002147FC38